MAERRYEECHVTCLWFTRDLIEGSMAAMALILTHTVGPAVVQNLKGLFVLGLQHK
jgi:hypothetical protein